MLDYESVEALRRRARQWRVGLNRQSIETCRAKRHWEDEVRGHGVHVTLEALDALVTQTMMLDEPPPYESALLLEDFTSIREHVMDQPPERAFPLFSALGDERSSPETAALLLRVLPGLKRILRHTGDWSHGLAADFEGLTEKALRFLLSSFQDVREGGGWGIFSDQPPQLYSTVAAIGALAGSAKAQRLLPEEQQEKARIEECLRNALRYLNACRREDHRFYRDTTPDEGYSVYSAYALQGLLALWDAGLREVNIERDVLSVLRKSAEVLKQDPGRAVYFQTEQGVRYEDHSGKWGWLRAVMLWLDRAPEFYEDRWHQAADELLQDLGVELERAQSSPVYLWNRAALALASYERYAIKYWTLSDYDLRKTIFKLFGQRDMTALVFDHVYSNVPKERSK